MRNNHSKIRHVSNHDIIMRKNIQTITCFLSRYKKISPLTIRLLSLSLSAPFLLRAEMFWREKYFWRQMKCCCYVNKTVINILQATHALLPSFSSLPSPFINSPKLTILQTSGCSLFI